MKSFLFIPLLLVLVLSCDEGPPIYQTAPNPDPEPVDPSVPKLTLAIGIETGSFSLEWSEPQGATYYTLQSAMLPSFFIPKTIYHGQARVYELSHEPEEPYSAYYRVRAEGAESENKWSNPVKYPE